jgi:hypothetical protein
VDLKHQTTFVSTTGIDETLQGISTDPFGRNLPTGFGLRVPPVITASIVAPNQPRYLFLLASRTIEREKTTIRGIRTGINLGINRSGTANQILPYELPVTSPYWRFPDGNVSWHLVREPNDVPTLQRPLTDTASWRYLRSDQPAMLYKKGSFDAGAYDPLTLAPIFYTVGLDGYTPPDFSPSQAQPIADLGNMRSIVYPWDPGSDNKLNIVVSGNCRISLYASVLQTNPATRLQPAALSSPISSGVSPEDAFLANFTTIGSPTVGPVYWRVYGSILFDDAFGAD